jgi:hypothetical protein
MTIPTLALTAFALLFGLLLIASFVPRSTVELDRLAEPDVQLHAGVYANQGVENTGWLNHAFIEKAAASVPGMQVGRLLDEQQSNAVIDIGKTIDGRANADNVSQTPTLLLGRTGGLLHTVSSKDTFDEARLAAKIRSLSGNR